MQASKGLRVREITRKYDFILQIITHYKGYYTVPDAKNIWPSRLSTSAHVYSAFYP